MTIAVIPVLCSITEIEAESFLRYSLGNPIATSIPVRITQKSGANACISTAAAHWPVSMRVMAVVKPHPGQRMPRACSIGHCHPCTPMLTRINCVRPTPRNMPVNQRFDNNDPSTGVKNQLNFKGLPVSSQRAVLAGCPYAGL